METQIPNKSVNQNGRKALFAGGLAAILASACCLGPLIFITLGISGAWISKLSILAPYQPIFIGLALIALFFAAKRIWRAPSVCLPGEICAVPQVKRTYKMLFFVALMLVLISLVFPFIAACFY